MHPVLGCGLGVGLLLLSSCSVDLPSYVISEGKMEAILYDYHLAQGMAESGGGNVAQNRYLYVQKVFEKHHVTEAEFDTSMVWYSGHASYLRDMYGRIDARLERESREAGLNIPEEDKFARFTAEGDTANIWQGRDVFFLHGNREENLYTLIIPADSSFHLGDYFMLRFSNIFVTQDRQREGFILFQVKYENDSVVGTSSMVSSDYDVILNIPENRVLAGQPVKSLSCTFYYSFDEEADDAFRMWMIRKPVLLRYHTMASLPADTLQAGEADSLATDTLAHAVQPVSGERISPQDFRNSQHVDHKINVVGKRNVVLPAQGGPGVVKRKKIAR